MGRRESKAGFHFYYLYLDCPRKWYIKYPLGLRYKYVAPPLIFGGAIHEAMFTYFDTWSMDRGMESFVESMREREHEYEDHEKFITDLDRGPKMLEVYVHKNANDINKYEILENETQHKVFIGPNEEFFITVRPDRVFRDRDTKAVFPVEVKTTGWSMNGMFNSTEDDDQVTSYIWALNKVHPEWKVDGCLIDVLYNRGKVFDTKRPGMAIRTKSQLTIFEMEFYGLVLELSQKYKALESTPWPLLFRANHNSCKKWGCEYKNICRTNCRPGKVPPMFIQDEWRSEIEIELKKGQNFSLEEYNK